MVCYLFTYCYLFQHLGGGCARLVLIDPNNEYERSSLSKEICFRWKTDALKGIVQVRSFKSIEYSRNYCDQKQMVKPFFHLAMPFVLTKGLVYVTLTNICFFCKTWLMFAPINNDFVVF